MPLDQVRLDLLQVQAHLALAGRDGAILRRQPLAGLCADLCLGGAAGDPGGCPARGNPRGEGVVTGQLLVSIVGFGALFKLYGSRFLMEHFWAALLVLFALAFLLAEGLAWLERRVEYFAASCG